MQIFRKRAEFVQAMKLVRPSDAKVAVDWINSHRPAGEDHEKARLQKGGRGKITGIAMPNGLFTSYASLGDWVVLRGDGIFCLVPPYIFETLYDSVDGEG